MTELPGASPSMDRRRFLTVLGGAGGLAVAWSTGAVPAAHAAGAPTANGWPVLGAGSGALASYVVEGTNVAVTLLSGETATVLLHVIRRFHYEVGALEPGQVVGHTEQPGPTPPESNHRSGTAVAIRPTQYPSGAKGGLFPHEVAIVRDILADCEGVVRWGGDYARAPKEGHFQIDVRPDSKALARVAHKLDGPHDSAGTTADPFTPARRRAAEALAHYQIATG
ncbi:hypothetical protein AB0G02_23940 [Actinosynnema sp. NPDC023658]|uniref:hypothetical protein n=1 Tax=Actinosynnema sp. NPDC023658 TaxID=3155465 RepID=UPI003406A19C